ncbi:MAG: M23 family metallopeptidase [Thermoanaerobaculia bacterium]
MDRRFRRLALLAVALAFAGQHLIERELRARETSQAPATAPASLHTPEQEAAPSRAVIPADAIAIPVAGVAKGALRDDFGAPRSRGRRHTAIDILAPRGTPAVAAIDGVILKLFESRNGGLTIYLADASRTTVFYYAHLDRYAEGLTEGARVARGSVIGFVGTTGNAPRDVPHLHFGVERLSSDGAWWQGRPENPYPLLLERGVTIPVE